MPINSGPGGQRRLIFTGNVKTNLFNKYTPGSGVGALSTSVRRRLKRSASSSQGSMNAQGKYIHGHRCCSAELQSKTINDNITVNQLLVLSNNFTQYINSMNGSAILEEAHTATPSTNNLVFGLRNSNVKITSPIMKQAFVGSEYDVSNVGIDLKIKIQLSVSHNGSINHNHTLEIQHNKVIKFINKNIVGFVHNGKPLSEYNVDITGEPNLDHEYGWIFILKSVNMATAFNNSDRIGFSPNLISLTPKLKYQKVFIRLTEPIINTTGTDGLTLTFTTSRPNIITISPSSVQWNLTENDWKTKKIIELNVIGDSNENIFDIISTTVTSNSELYNNYNPNFTVTHIA